jgi:hypothetical protein
MHITEPQHDNINYKQLFERELHEKDRLKDYVERLEGQMITMLSNGKVPMINCHSNASTKDSNISAIFDQVKSTVSKTPDEENIESDSNLQETTSEINLNGAFLTKIVHHKNSL